MRNLILISLILISCDNSSQNVNLDEYPSKDGITLAFDLSIPVCDAKLLITNVQVNRSYKYFLPFKTAESRNDVDILSATAHYEKFTFVNFVSSNKPSSIYFRPIIAEFDQSELFTRTPEDGVYLVKNGLERLFVYDYDYMNNYSLSVRKVDVLVDSLDYIAIKLPLKSQGKEIKDGKTVSHELLKESTEYIKMFSAKENGKLQVKYQLTTELSKAEWYVLLMKSILLIVVPLLEALLLSLVADPRSKATMFWIFVLIEAALLVGMIVMGYSGKYIGYNVLIDSITNACVAILSTIIVYLRSVKDAVPKRS
jgi:hypothetical protein